MWVAVKVSFNGRSVVFLDVLINFDPSPMFP